MPELPPRGALAISIQRALLGNVVDTLVAVTAGFVGSEIRINAYFASQPTDNDIEEIRCVGTEVVADFPEPYSIHELCASLPANKTLELLDFIAFLRAGYDDLKFV